MGSLNLRNVAVLERPCWPPLAEEAGTSGHSHLRPHFPLRCLACSAVSTGLHNPQSTPSLTSDFLLPFDTELSYSLSFSGHRGCDEP